MSRSSVSLWLRIRHSHPDCFVSADSALLFVCVIVDDKTCWLHVVFYSNVQMIEAIVAHQITSLVRRFVLAVSTLFSGDTVSLMTWVRFSALQKGQARGFGPA